MTREHTHVEIDAEFEAKPWRPTIRNLGNGLVMATCPQCRGSGIYYHGQYMPGTYCERCGGVGEIQVR